MRLGSREALRREEPALRCPRTHGAQHVGADGRRNQSDLHLAEAIPGRVGAHRDVAGRDQAHAARVHITLHPRDHRFRALVDRAQHGSEAAGIGDVLLAREIGRAAHPVEVGTSAEGRPVRAEHDGADVGRRARLREGLAQFADDRFVEGVARVGAVQPDARDRAFEGELERGEWRAHAERASC
jgi:hypothetical protein